MQPAGGQKKSSKVLNPYAKKLLAAKSMPEVASVCQEWMNRRMEPFT
jgi:hypothetical protein